MLKVKQEDVILYLARAVHEVLDIKVTVARQWPQLVRCAPAHSDEHHGPHDHHWPVVFVASMHCEETFAQETRVDIVKLYRKNGGAPVYYHINVSPSLVVVEVASMQKPHCFVIRPPLWQLELFLLHVLLVTG